MKEWIALCFPLQAALLAAFPAGTLLAVGGYLLVFSRRLGRRAGAMLFAAGSGLWLGDASYLLFALFPAR